MSPLGYKDYHLVIKITRQHVSPWRQLLGNFVN